MFYYYVTNGFKYYDNYMTCIGITSNPAAKLRSFRTLIQNIKFAGTVMGEDFQDAVANHTFGDKLAGDIGARSTQGHPKTDYGEPRFGSGWDIDTK
jgi:hypothetical protein